MGFRLTVNLDEQALDGVIAQYLALPQQIERASTRAIRKTTSWLASQVSREMAREHNVPLKSILSKGQAYSRVRNFTKTAGDETQGVVWVGTNPIKAAYLGALRQQKTGARAGKQFFERAFVATMKSGHRSVWLRDGKARFPISEQEHELSEATAVVERLSAQVPTRLTTLLNQELNYEINVRGA